MLFGRLARDPDWLRKVAEVDPTPRSTRIAPALADARRAALLVFARWVLVMTNFERSLYADPDADLDTLWWDLVERYQLVHRPDGRARTRLGGEDPPRRRARLLPELPLRRAVRVAARRHARDARRPAWSTAPRPAQLLVRDVFAPGRVVAVGRSS